jgi:acetyltransferase-like isoleucine patch superfamily enzyme
MKIGTDVIIDEFTRFKRPELVTIGNRVAIDYGFYCTTQLEIGDYVHISAYVSCIGGKEVKLVVKGFNNIMAGARIICSTDRFDGRGIAGILVPKELRGRFISGDVVMEEFSNVGTNAIVLPGAILRRGVLLTAGSLLIGDTREWGVYKGNPAIWVRRVKEKQIIENAIKLGYDEEKGL